jgi:hypothetical protein
MGRLTAIGVGSAIAGAEALVFDVKAFGAVGNGVAFDDAAVAACVAAATAAPTHGMVYFPAGIYRFASQPVWPGLMSYRGAGRFVSILLFSGCSGPLIVNAGTDFTESFLTITDLTLRGDYTQIGVVNGASALTGTATVTIPHALGTGDYRFEPTYTTTPTGYITLIRNSTATLIKSSVVGDTSAFTFSLVPGTTGLTLRYVHNVVLDNVAIEQFGNSGLHMSRCFVVSLRSCLLWNNDGHGLFFEDSCTCVDSVNSWYTYNNGWGVVATPLTNGVYQGPMTITGGSIQANRDGGLLLDNVQGMGFHSIDLELVGTLNTGAGRNPGVLPRRITHLWMGSWGSCRGLQMDGVAFAGPANAAAVDAYAAVFDRVNGGQVQGCYVSGQPTFFTRAWNTSLGGSVNLVIEPSVGYGTAITTVDQESGSVTLNGTGGIVVSRVFGGNTYQVVLTPKAALAGSLYITKGNNSFTIFSTSAADTTQGCDWSLTRVL